MEKELEIMKEENVITNLKQENNKNTNWFYKPIPQFLRKELSFNFCKSMLKELHLIFGIALEDFEDYLYGILGTYGWNSAFMTTCRTFNKVELMKYYNKLAWYESDWFDSDLLDLFCAYGLIIKNNEENEIARQNDIKVKKVKYCSNCGEYYHKKDFIITFEEDTAICFNCFYKSDKKASNKNKIKKKSKNKNKEVKVLTYDKSLMIEELLGLEQKEYFVCEKCKKIHYTYNKKDKEHNVCNYCANGQKTITKDYEEKCIENERFLRTYIPKKEIYKGINIELKYKQSIKMFIGKADINEEIYYSHTMEDLLDIIKKEVDKTLELRVKS